MPATPVPAPMAEARALAVTSNDRRDDDDAILNLLPVVIDGVDRLYSLRRWAERLFGMPSHEAEHPCRVQKRQAESPLQAWADEPQPREMNESRAEER